MSIRTDLALELKNSLNRPHIPGVDSQIQQEDFDITVTKVTITEEVGAKIIGKPIGNYITIEAKAISNRELDMESYLESVLSRELKTMLPENENFSALVVGLGNRHITADALGSATIDKLMITRHIRDFLPKEVQPDVRSVCAITPGVLGITGIESADIVKSIVDSVSPDVVIIIDSLASRSTERIGTAFQITDTGISPGSGIGNKRIGLNADTLGAKVIAIGVPMVVYSSTIVHDMISSLAECSNLKETDVSQMIADLLPEKDLVVTPKEIDVMIDDTSKILAQSLNLSLHRDLSADFINQLTH